MQLFENAFTSQVVLVCVNVILVCYLCHCKPSGYLLYSLSHSLIMCFRGVYMLPNLPLHCHLNLWDRFQKRQIPWAKKRAAKTRLKGKLMHWLHVGFTRVCHWHFTKTSWICVNLCEKGINYLLWLAAQCHCQSIPLSSHIPFIHMGPKETPCACW